MTQQIQNELLPFPINEVAGTAIASAATVNLTTATGNFVHVTGTVAITAITLAQGAERTVVFDGALVLTNGASLLLPGAANITTAAGDVAIFRGDAAGVVRCVSYTPVSGKSVSGGTAYRLRVLGSGTTYTVPTDVKSFYAFVYGATGGSAANVGSVGGCGYSEKYYASPSASYTFALGAAGASGGSAGGTTTFDVMSITSSGGTTTTAGSSGGVGSGGDFNATGGSGGSYSTNAGGSGGAGSRAGNGGNGGNGGGNFGGGGGTGGNAGGAANNILGAYATVKSASALTLPWVNSTEYFDGGDGSTTTGSAGASPYSGINANTIYSLATSLKSNAANIVFIIGPNTNARNGLSAGVGTAGGIYIVEILK